MSLAQSIVNDLYPGSPAGTSNNYNLFNLGSTNPSYIRNYLGTQAGASLASRQSLANSLYGNKAGISSQEIDAALKLQGSVAPSPQQNAPQQNATFAPSASSPTGLSAAQLADLSTSIHNTNAALGDLGSQQAAGDTTIQNQLSDALNQLGLAKGAANTQYTNSQTADKQNYVAGKNTIGANAGASLNGLLRLLGSRGAGGGTAYNVLAPGAIARQATLQRNDLGNTFGQNEKSLTDNWNTYLQGYDQNVAQTNKQAQDQEGALANSISQNKASLLQTLASLQAQSGASSSTYQPTLDQANSILANLSHYSVPALNYTPQTYSSPTAASYTTNPNATPTLQGQTAPNDYTSPYLQALLKQKVPGASPAPATA